MHLVKHGLLGAVGPTFSTLAISARVTVCPPQYSVVCCHIVQYAGNKLALLHLNAG